MPAKTIKELPLSSKPKSYWNNAQSQNSNPHRRESSQLLRRLQINEYSAHSAIMAFKNSKEYPVLLSKFGTAPVNNFRGCSVQINYNLNLYGQQQTGVLELISKETFCSREHCVGQLTAQLFITQFQCCYNVIIVNQL